MHWAGPGFLDSFSALPRSIGLCDQAAFASSLCSEHASFGVRNPSAECGRWRLEKVDPAIHDPRGFEAILDVLKVDGLIFHRPPEPFDEILSVQRPRPSMLILHRMWVDDIDIRSDTARPDAV